jgi:hypothetical protein
MSWRELQDIVDEARDLDQEIADRPLVDCPRCGTPLDIRPRDGLRHCPMGHFETTAETHGAYYGSPA